MSVLKDKNADILGKTLDQYINRDFNVKKVSEMTDALSEIYKVISKFTREEQQDILAAANVLIGNKK